MQTVKINPLAISIPMMGRFNLTGIATLSLSGLSIYNKDFLNTRPYLSIGFETDSETRPKYEMGGGYEVFGEAIFESLRTVVMDNNGETLLLDGIGMSLTKATDVSFGFNLSNGEVFGVAYSCTEEDVSASEVKQLPQGVFYADGKQMQLVLARVKVFELTEHKSVKIPEGNILGEKIIETVAIALGTQIYL